MKRIEIFETREDFLKYNLDKSKENGNERLSSMLEIAMKYDDDNQDKKTIQKQLPRHTGRLDRVNGLHQAVKIIERIRTKK